MLNPKLKNKKLLIVDDDETFAAIMARVQKRAGFQVFVANTIQSAIDLCQQHQTEYAVVDLKLQQESGLELIPALLAIHPRMRIVILTGYASIPTAVEAIKLGAVQYLTKPADAKDIIQALLSNESGNPEIELPEEPMSVQRLEWEHIQKVLMLNEGNISATAKALNMHRRTLQRKLQKRPVKQ